MKINIHALCSGAFLLPYTMMVLLAGVKIRKFWIFYSSFILFLFKASHCSTWNWHWVNSIGRVRSPPGAKFAPSSKANTHYVWSMTNVADHSFQGSVTAWSWLRFTPTLYAFPTSSSTYSDFLFLWSLQFYNVIIAFALHYFYASFTTKLPWSSCSGQCPILALDQFDYFFFNFSFKTIPPPVMSPVGVTIPINVRRRNPLGQMQRRWWPEGTVRRASASRLRDPCRQPRNIFSGLAGNSRSGIRNDSGAIWILTILCPCPNCRFALLFIEQSPTFVYFSPNL